MINDLENLDHVFQRPKIIAHRIAALHVYFFTPQGLQQ